MAIVRKIGINEYVEKSGEQIVRIWPIDAYEIPAKIKALASEYHVLKVPLLGQIPIDINTREAGDRGCPIFLAEPSSPVTAAFGEIAKRVEQAVG